MKCVYPVRKAVNMLYNERAIREISSKFEDQNFKYVSFPGGPAFDFTGTMTIDVSEVMEDFRRQLPCLPLPQRRAGENRCNRRRDEETVSFETKNLGRFVLTDKEIADGTIVDESFVSQPEATPEAKPTQIGGVTSQAKDQLSAHRQCFGKQ